MEVFNHCVMPSRLEIMFNPEAKKICMSRCCYLETFVDGLSIEEFLKIDDVIAYAEDLSSKVPITKKESFKDWCRFPCELTDHIEVVTISFSKACNLHCYHCFFSYHKDEPYVKDLQFETLEKIKGHNLKKLHLISSGEVFFYYYKLINFLKGLTVNDVEEIDFQSNMTLLSKSRIEELKKISEETGVHYCFSPSIDGITKETFEAVRFGASFDQVMENVEYCGKLFGNDSIYVNFTLKAPNFTDLPEIRKFFATKGIYNVQITPDIYDEKAKELLQNYEKN